MSSSVESPVVFQWPEAGRMESQSPRTEAELVAACRAGAREAFDELVRRYYDRLSRLAGVMAGPGAAADLVQETFLAALRSFGRFRGEAQLSTWLISILRNQVSLHLRGKRRTMAPLESEGRRLAAPRTDGRDAEEGLRLVFERVKDLPEELRETLALFYIEGLKYAEIARVMECPIGTVRSRLFEARERLKKLCETREA
jgi:RNA polymerase sigma-70 factor (ECF subfamily)